MTSLDPWNAFANRHKQGERIFGSIIKNVRDIGLFVALEDDVVGLVHLNDLDWTMPSEYAITLYLVGDDIETVILSINPEAQQVSLGIKQLGPDPRSDDRGYPLPIEPRTPLRPSSSSATLSRNIGSAS